MATVKHPKTATLGTIRQQIVGLDKKVPTLSGTLRTYINFDNAASTPPFVEVLKTVNDFAPWYSSVHRGSGFKSQIASEAYEEARQVVLDFFGANPDDYVAIFGKNTTEAINKLSYRLELDKDDVVLVGLTEHHSNDLPWRRVAHVEHIDIDETGRLSVTDAEGLFKKFGGRVKLLAVSGASNVTGAVPDIHKLAKLAHAHGVQILVDCAQLAPHRPINMKRLSDPEHLDYIAVSAHKMYAPFGSGVLIGRRDTFERGDPEICGGGTISVVTEDEVEWAEAPDRDEAGSPNVIGAVAFAKALKHLSVVGMTRIASHETELTTHALKRLKEIPGLTIYGQEDPRRVAERLGVITFNLANIHHSLVAAILSAEWGIGVRSGCFCAHPYVTKLLGLDAAQTKQFRTNVHGGDRSRIPGMVRISFGVYNTKDEIDVLVDALDQITARAYEGDYVQNKTTGEFQARGWQPNLSDYFAF